MWDVFFDVIDVELLMGEFDFDGFGGGCGVVVDEDLGL